MRERGEAPLLPPNPAPYLTDWLFDVGPTVGDAIVSYADLAAWQAVTGVELLPWEARIIRQLSGAFMDQRFRARKPDCPAPYDEEEQARDRVTHQFAAMMRGLGKRVSG